MKNVGTPFGRVGVAARYGLIEEEPVLHHARPAVERGHSMNSFDPTLLDHADDAAGGVAIFGRRNGGEHFHFGDEF